MLVDTSDHTPHSLLPQSLHLRRSRPCSQMPLPPQSLHLLRPRPCSQMLLPPQSLHQFRCRPCSQRCLPPPQSLHWLRTRPCLQSPLPPQSLHLLRCRPCSHFLFTMSTRSRREKPETTRSVGEQRRSAAAVASARLEFSHQLLKPHLPKSSAAQGMHAAREIQTFWRPRGGGAAPPTPVKSPKRRHGSGVGKGRCGGCGGCTEEHKRVVLPLAAARVLRLLACGALRPVPDARLRGHPAHLGQQHLRLLLCRVHPPLRLRARVLLAQRGAL